ncbi:dihydroorotate dehydrogenase-like protein [Deferribacter autotrophicus]|uniref:Dihydroorotate dehydrogenase-like protein n=1 Tax=Deferribacter autotrophicus TaxID=500465 RepID=A0A5A8F159_9BACT|nr:dihydroorotate dehydrogenase-like protein [Deferribacter autotrophicus]KAA0257121.1 dihydroorotate dehydrogenase-like protein [Deferribacter autotrophicus]
MADLKTFYLGYELKNPIILASCSLTKNVDNICQAESAGVSAVVLKSLFEEEIKSEMGAVSNDFHPEAYEYEYSSAGLMYGASKYLDLIKEAKKRVKIPVFASVNCIDSEIWIDYAKSIEDAGADGLELNISYISFNINDDPREVEKRYLNIVENVKTSLNIPVAVKIGWYFTSIPYMVKSLKDAGADGIVMFNRYYQLSYDIEKEKFMLVNYFSSDTETYQVLRWVGIVHKQVDIDIAATGGIHNAKQILEHIFMGASVVELASVFYKNGIKYAENLLTELNEIMDDLNMASIKDIKGKGIDTIEEFKSLERVQYMKILGGEE